MSSSRNTLRILSDICHVLHIDEVPFASRMLDGFERYGSENHLSEDFDVTEEHKAESMDDITFFAIGFSRQDYDWHDPNCWAALRGHREAWQRMQLRPCKIPQRPLHIFVSGPYTGETELEIAENVVIAERFSQELMRLGHIPFCPHSMTHNWDRGTGLRWEDFMELCLATLERCDAIYLLPRWNESRGSMLELERAKSLRLFEFSITEQVPDLRQMESGEHSGDAG